MRKFIIATLAAVVKGHSFRKLNPSILSIIFLWELLAIQKHLYIRVRVLPALELWS